MVTQDMFLYHASSHLLLGILLLAKSSCLFTYHLMHNIPFTLKTHSLWSAATSEEFDNDWVISLSITLPLVCFCLTALLGICLIRSFSFSVFFSSAVLSDVSLYIYVVLSFLISCFALRWLYCFISDMRTFLWRLQVVGMKSDLFLSFAKCHINCPVFTGSFSLLRMCLKLPFLRQDVLFFLWLGLDCDLFLYISK